LDEEGDEESLDASSADGERPARPGGGGRPAAGNSAPGVIASRDDVIAAIDRILLYYQQYEPSSPLPLLLMRAKRLATKSFIEILQDLIPEGLERAHEIGGLTQSTDGEAAPVTSSPPSESAFSSDTTDDSTDDTDDDFFS